MRLEEYIEKIDKNACPKECEFQSKEEIEIAKVPPPKNIVGIIISRDPTRKWVDKGYKKAMKLSGDERREILFEAIPESLIKQIKKFKEFKEKEEGKLRGRICINALQIVAMNQQNLKTRMLKNVQTNGWLKNLIVQ